MYKYHCNDCDKFFNLLSELQEHVKVTEHYDYELIELKAQVAWTSRQELGRCTGLVVQNSNALIRYSVHLVDMSLQQRSWFKV